ncbi:MAG: ABC transporter permease [Myxococcota bacterium]
MTSAELLELLREGFAGVRINRVRSLLSSLGILFGVAAILGILSIGEGARREQEALISRLGILNFQIHNVDLDDDPERRKEVRRVSPGLSDRDVEALREALPAVTQVGAAREIPHQEVVPRPSDPSKIKLLGATPGWLSGSSLVRTRGRALDAQDEERRAIVCVIGEGAARNLFGPEDPIGQKIRTGSVWLTVVGVFRDASGGSQGGSGPGGSLGVEVDDRRGTIVMPLRTALDRFGLTTGGENDPPPLSEVQVTVASIEDVRSHVAIADRVLTRTHREQRDFEIEVPLRLLEQSREQQRLFSLTMGLIAGISLLVGGIGIMNIMLASVLERTREVGIRLAVGARPRDIAGLFLVEAALISLVGGLAGVVAGLAMSSLVAAATGWATAVSPQAVLGVLLLSMLEGVVFGYLPARRASQLPPVIAVRQT